MLKSIGPGKLQHRLWGDLGFSHSELKKEFNGLFEHAKKISEYFLLIDGESSDEEAPSKPQRNMSINRQGAKGEKMTSGSSMDPICLWGPHKVRGILHRLRDCRERPESERKSLFEDLSRNKASDGSAKNTRSKVPYAHKTVTGRLPVTDQSQ